MKDLMVDCFLIQAEELIMVLLDWVIVFLGYSDRDIVKYYRSYKDFTGALVLTNKLKKTCYNYNQI